MHEGRSRLYPRMTTLELDKLGRLPFGGFVEIENRGQARPAPGRAVILMVIEIRRFAAGVVEVPQVTASTRVVCITWSCTFNGL